MRIIEILLPKGTLDRTLSAKQIQDIHVLQKRMSGYVDKIIDPRTPLQGKEFLKSRLRDDYYDLKDALAPISIDKFVESQVMEAIHKLPISNEDFELVKKLMDNPIPAIIAPIYIQEVIDDDELKDQISSLENTDPGRDVRPIIAEWFNRVMPDQMYRFTQNHRSELQKKGIFSPIHGYDPKSFKGSTDTGAASSGDAYGYS